MHKYFLVLLISANLFAGSFYISHIPEKNWDTKVDIINISNAQETVYIKHWNNDGTLTRNFSLVVEGKQNIILSSIDFGVEGIVKLTTENTGTLIVKISYKLNPLGKEVEMFIPENKLSNEWVLPVSNSYSFDWLGLAVANFGEAETSLTFQALKNNQILTEVEDTLAVNRKTVDLLENLMNGVTMDEIDYIKINSEVPIACPLMIAGNNNQTFHNLTSGQIVPEKLIYERKYFIPHIASSSWKTKITIYSLEDREAYFHLSAWNQEGVLEIDNEQISIAEGKVVLESGTDFNCNSSILITMWYDNRIKVSYSFAENEEYCYYFIENALGRKWIVPNINGQWKTWSGISITNFNEEVVNITIKAFKNKGEIGEVSGIIEPHFKFVGLITSFLEDYNIGENDFDYLLIESDKVIPAPMVIAGNTTQTQMLCNAGADASAILDIPDENFKAVLLKYFDITRDGEISDNEAKTVDLYVNIRKQGIKDLTGIEFFSNIVDLNCARNELTILDVRKNKKLGELACYDNKLTYLDVSNNTKLFKLYCDQNEISSIDISNNTELQRFFCQENEITSLDISKNPLLTTVICFDNNIPSLDLKENSLLTYLDCSKNQISELDFSNNLFLRSVKCDDNQLTDIPDITMLPEISFYSCSENYFGTDDCPLIKKILDMDLRDFIYNPQNNESELICE